MIGCQVFLYADFTKSKDLFLGMKYRSWLDEMALGKKKGRQILAGIVIYLITYNNTVVS